jgi:hypothetical protein
MNFLKFIRVRSTARVSQQGAIDSTRKMIIRADWLRKKITVEEAEAENPGITDDRVTRFPEAAGPFGFLNRQWEALKAQIKPSDELWTFISPTESWQQFTGLMGVAFLRDRKVIDVIVSEMN